MIVLGSKQGAQTDENGSFTIVGVPVGTAQVQVQAIGFDKQVKEVQINAGQTASVEFTLGSSKVVKQIEEIEVSAKKQIDTKSSTSKQTITAQSIGPPGRQPDAGGLGETSVVAQGGELLPRRTRRRVKFQIDGVEVSDPLFGGGANIANLAVAGADVLSGGMDAEYGNALSGVVAVSTKEGTEKFGGEVRWDTDRYGDPTKTYDNFDRFTFGFGGPTPVKNLTYFATYEGTFQDTYTPTSLTRPSRTLWDFIALGNRQSNQVNTNLKLAYRISPRHKLTLETINNRTINTPYNHMWSRQGYVQVTYDTVRANGMPGTYQPCSSWSARRSTARTSRSTCPTTCRPPMTSSRPDRRVDQPALRQDGVDDVPPSSASRPCSRSVEAALGLQISPQYWDGTP